MNLDGRVAVITGGGAGIGRAIALRLAADGARVSVLDIRQESAQETLELAGGEGTAGSGTAELPSVAPPVAVRA